MDLVIERAPRGYAARVIRQQSAGPRCVTCADPQPGVHMRDFACELVALIEMDQLPPRPRHENVITTIGRDKCPSMSAAINLSPSRSKALDVSERTVASVLISRRRALSGQRTEGLIWERRLQGECVPDNLGDHPGSDSVRGTPMQAHSPRHPGRVGEKRGSRRTAPAHGMGVA